MNKYRLVLLDDEEIVTNGIQKVFDLDALGFEVVGIFHNPEKALEQLENLQPDMIITDVKMPQMDGLDFSRMAKKIFPEIEIVILSGYDDFSYAQAAIKLGIRDYLLKPIKKLDFNTMMKGMYQKISDKKAEKQYYQSLLEFVENNYAEYKNNFFLNLAEGGEFDETQYNTIMNKVGCDFLRKKYLLIKVDVYKMPVEMDYVSEIGKIYQQMNDELVVYGQVEEFATDESLFFLLYSVDTEDVSDIRTTVIDLMEALRQKGIALTAGISLEHQGPEEFFLARNDCIRQIFMKEMHIDEASDANPIRQSESNLNVPYMELENLFRGISMKDGDVMRRSIDKLDDISGDTSHNLYREYSVTITFLILLRMCQLQNKYDFSSHIVSPELLDLKHLKKVHSTSEAQKKLVEGFATALSELIAEKEISEPSKMIVAALTYINGHFCENISLADVAENINISKNYLCDIFKKELGITFMNYVTSLRIEKAKDYLANTDMKMYEVSCAVGYSDYAYFSQIFKKHTGTTLSAYRRQN